MFDVLSLNEFWFSSAPILLIGGLAALVIVFDEWQVGLPALALAQFLFGATGVQRDVLPERWAWVFAWVLLGCVLILFLSLMQTRQPAPTGRFGGYLFRGLLLGLAAFLLADREVKGLLPVLDEELIRLSLWLALCGLIGLATGGSVLKNSLALLLWLVSTELALIAVAPAAVIVVVLGALCLVTALACGYLLVAEDVTLAANRRPLTDPVFPVGSPGAPSVPRAASASTGTAIGRWVAVHVFQQRTGSQT